MRDAPDGPAAADPDFVNGDDIDPAAVTDPADGYQPPANPDAEPDGAA